MKKYTVQVVAKSYKDLELGERKLKGDLIEVTQERAEKLVSLGLVQVMGIEEVDAKVKTKATTEKEVRAKSPKAKENKAKAEKAKAEEKKAKETKAKEMVDAQVEEVAEEKAVEETAEPVAEEK